MQNPLESFLNKNTIPSSTLMPLVHSTTAYAAKRIVASEIIKPSPCDVFQGEDLTYLFYGRPSYKRSSHQEISKYWELPSVFVFDYDQIQSKRIYPFDTGAFQKNIYPDYLTMMSMSDFEVSNQQRSPQKLVASFFVDTRRYFKLMPRDRRDFSTRFTVTSDDEEVNALYDLVLHHSGRFDDRRFAIEVQCTEEIKLKESGLIALILPDEYLESANIVQFAENNHVELLTYPTFPLKQEMYYQAIYNNIFELYRHKGYVK